MRLTSREEDENLPHDLGHHIKHVQDGDYVHTGDDQVLFLGKLPPGKFHAGLSGPFEEQEDGHEVDKHVDVYHGFETSESHVSDLETLRVHVPPPVILLQESSVNILQGVQGE